MYEMSTFGMYFLGRISEEPKYTSRMSIWSGFEEEIYAGEGIQIFLRKSPTIPTQRSRPFHRFAPFKT